MKHSKTSRPAQFAYQASNSIQNIVFEWLKELPTSEMFFGLFNNRLVTAEQIRNMNKFPRLKELNTFRQGLRIEFVRSIQAKINPYKEDISDAIDLMVEIGADDINKIPFNVFEGLNFNTLTKKKIQAIIKIYS